MSEIKIVVISGHIVVVAFFFSNFSLIIFILRTPYFLTIVIQWKYQLRSSLKCKCYCGMQHLALQFFLTLLAYHISY